MYVANILILCYTENTCILLQSLTFVVRKIPQHAHVFFWVCSTPGPMSSPDTALKFTVSQWDHASSTAGYHDHVSTASSQRDCVSQTTLSHYNLVNRCGWRSLSHSSPLSETRHVSSDFYSKTYHPAEWQISSLDFLVLFLYPATEVWNLSASCLVKQDMSAGDNANCCSGRLSKG